MRIRIMLLAICIGCILFGVLYLSLTARAQDPQITIQCGASLRPVAEVQADSSVKVTCKASVIPTPTPTPTPTPPPPPTTTPPGNGAVWIATPANLQSLIGKGSPAKPGDTVRLTSGVYLPPQSPELPIRRFEVHSPGIKLVGVPGAMLEGKDAKYGALYVAAEGVIVEDVEITNTLTDRTAERGPGIEVAGADVTLRRLRVHDCGNGIFASQSALSLLIEDCIVYNNGWQGLPPDRAHGHGIYCQNANSIKVIRRNIVLANYGAGIHLFGQSGRVDNFLIEDNIVGLNGKTLERQVLIGGQEPSQGIRFNRNFVFTDWNAEYQPNVFIGYRPGNLNFEAVGNWLVGGTGVYIVGWERFAFRDNLVAAKARTLTFDSPDWRGEWSGNQYYSLGPFPFASQGGLPVKVWSPAEWAGFTKDATSKFTPAPMDGPPLVRRYGQVLAVYSGGAEYKFLESAVDPITGEPIKSCPAKAFCVGVLK